MPTKIIVHPIEKIDIHKGAWMYEKVILKDTSELLYLIPLPKDMLYFLVTAETETQIQINNYPRWFDKSEFEFYAQNIV